MTYVMLLLTSLVSFYKADFLNLTIYCLAAYTFTFAERGQYTIDWDMWRLIVVGTVISMIYDILWFIIRHGDLAADKDAEGNIESSVKRFSLYTAYVVFFIKIVTAFVYWKV